MSRTLSIRNVIDKKHLVFDFDGVFQQVLADPEKSGTWLIFGKDKNGKTWGTLLFAQYLSITNKVLYISAEQGIGKSFKDAVIRAKLNTNNRNLQFTGYILLEELIERLKKKRAPNVVIVDNVTFYTDQLTKKALEKLLLDFPNTLFIFLAHEERGEPYTAIAKYIKKLAEIIINVQGLAFIVGGRCPGGTLYIDEEKAALYHGQPQAS